MTWWVILLAVVGALVLGALAVGGAWAAWTWLKVSRIRRANEYMYAVCLLEPQGPPGRWTPIEAGYHSSRVFAEQHLAQVQRDDPSAGYRVCRTKRWKPIEVAVVHKS